jgi:hypothetical protein
VNGKEYSHWASVLFQWCSVVFQRVNDKEYSDEWS